MKKIITIVLLLFSIQLFSQYPDRPLNNIALEDYLPENVSYPFSFVVLRDTRDGNSNPALSPDFLIILEQIANLHPVFVINAGDVLHDGYETEYEVYYDTIFNWMSNNSIPFLTVPGNHEFRVANSYELYPRYIGAYDFSFDIGNCRIVAINNVQHCSGCEDFYISDTSLEFVKEKLSDPSSPPNKFGFTHVPLFIYGGDNIYNNYSYLQYWDLLCNYGAKANFCGHKHQYYRKYLCNGIFDITTGGGGAPMDTGIDSIPVNHFQLHFLLVTVSEDNSVKVEMFFMDGGHNEIAQQYDFIMPTSENMFLQNQIIHSGETRTFTAQKTIEVAGNGTEFIVKEGSNVEMVAGESIRLGQGFQASGNFHAYIQDVDCDDVKEKDKTIKQANNWQFNDNQPIDDDNIIINRQNTVCIFPNPNNGIFTLYFTGNTGNINQIKINDITGKNIYLSNNIDIENENFIVIDISEQKSGVYILELTYNNTIYTKKLIIQ